MPFTCSPVECNVSYYNVLIRLKLRSVRRAYDKLAARKTFSKIIVAVSHQLQCQTFRDKCAEALAARAFTLDHEAVVFQTFRISSRDLGSEDRAECTVRVRNVDLKPSLLPFLQCRKKLFYKDFLIQCLLKFKVKYFLRVKIMPFFCLAYGL